MVFRSRRFPGLLRRLAFAVLPSADIHMDYVIGIAASRWQRLADGGSEMQDQ